MPQLDELVGIKKKIAKLLEKHGVFDIEDELIAIVLKEVAWRIEKMDTERLNYYYIPFDWLEALKSGTIKE